MDPIIESLTREWMNSLMFHHPVSSGVDGLLRIAGVVHLYGASGIHLYAILSWIRVLAKQAASLAGISAKSTEFLVLGLFLGTAFLVWRLQGFSFALFRPLSSILLRSFFREKGARISIFLPLLITLFLEWILCLQRGLGPGAWHYYLAVGGSLVALARHESNGSGLALHFRMAVYSWVPVALLDVFRDGMVSPLTPVLSLLTIPPLTVILFPLSLFFELAWGGIPDWLFSLWLGFFKILLFLLDLLPPIHFPGRPAFGLSALLIAMFHFLSRKFSFRGPLLMPPLILAVVFARLFPSFAPPERVVQLDVGQGDSALIQSGGRSELIDAGPVSNPGAEGWIRRLGRFGAGRPDALLLTHLDQDHAGGLHALLSVTGVACIEISRFHQASPKGREMLAWLAPLQGAAGVAESGCIRLSEVAWFPSSRHGSAGNRWMGGVVRRISDEETYFALGDGDTRQEAEFLRRFGRLVRSSRFRIWKVGHHGSRFSGDPGFLSALDPDLSWISVGRRNPYHHPAPATLARLHLLRGGVHRTDEEGDLVHRKGESTRYTCQESTLRTFFRCESKKAIATGLF
jgi:competence protein ComEC